MNEIVNSQSPRDFFDDLFDFSEEDPVDIKKTSFASNFCALIHHAGLNRLELAEILDWKPSRLSKVLSGSENLTIKTMVQLAVALDYDFDIHFHKANEHRSLQPWEDSLLIYLSKVSEVKSFNIHIDNHNYLKNISNDIQSYHTQNILNGSYEIPKAKSLYREI